MVEKTEDYTIFLLQPWNAEPSGIADLTWYLTRQKFWILNKIWSSAWTKSVLRAKQTAFWGYSEDVAAAFDYFKLKAATVE